MPVNETIELVARAREELKRAPRRRDREPRAPRALSPTPTTCSSTRWQEAAATAVLSQRAGPGAAAVARCGPAPRGCRCAAAGRLHLSELRDAVDLPLLLLPYLFVRRPRPAGDPNGRRSPGSGAHVEHDRAGAPSLALVAVRPVRFVVFCGSGGVGQDVRPRRPAAAHRPRPGWVARCSCSPSDPAKAPCRRGWGWRRFGKRGPPGAARRLRRARRRNRAGELWAAMLDNQTLVGRARAPARAR